MSAVLKRLSPANWGVTTIAGRTVPVRLVVAAAGAAVWLLMMLFNTGTGGIVALWTNLLLLAALLLVCSLTRTVSVAQIIQFVFLGGFFMGVALVIGRALTIRGGERDTLIPFVEETLKIAPVLWVLWRWRRSRIWSIGATDVLLLAAASGAGFGLVEDAYIRHLRVWPGHLPWLPVTAIIGVRVIPGHAIWTTLAGLTIGVALMFRGRRALVCSLAPSGFVLSLIDHIANNYGVDNRGWLSRVVNDLTGHGYLIIDLLAIGIVFAVALDLLAWLQLPKLAELRRPATITRLRAVWMFATEKRALAYALFRSRQASGIARAEAICSAALIDAALLNLRWLAETTPPAPDPPQRLAL